MRDAARRDPSWIPAEPLVFAQLSLLASWVLLFIAGERGDVAQSPIGFAWIHAVVLGWLTCTALAFLVHVLPTFTDVPLRFARLARNALWLFEAGTVAIVAGFAFWAPVAILAGGAAVGLAVTLALVSLLATAAQAMRSADRTTRAVARAFFVVFALLGVTVGLGVAMSVGLARGSAFVARLAPLHGAIGTIGWLALLVAGVSMRTYNVLLGRTVSRTAHIATSTLVLAGLTTWVVGRLVPDTVAAVAGGVLLGLGALTALAATAHAALGSRVAHRLPREFVVAATFWLCVAIAYGGAALAGLDVAPALLFAILLGWIGQNVNAHMMHVGIRLLSTLVISGDDETRPVELLDRRLGVASFWLYQAAVACGVAGLTIGNASLLEVGGVTGFAGTLASLANVASAGRRAARRRGMVLL